MAPKIFIDGEHGTTGLQIRQRLGKRDDIELISLASEDRRDNAKREQMLRDADIAILCLPDDAAREAVSMVEGHGTRLIDASSAHRVASGWVYGFPEMERKQADRIRQATYVSNPGCWPQGPIALLRPLVSAGLIPEDYPVTVSGISGYSGGGKAMIADYEEKGEDAPEFMPYALTLKHKHIPELKANALLTTDPLMQPAVGDFAQGMVTMVPLQLGHLEDRPKGADLHAAIADHYDGLDDSNVEVAPFDETERSTDITPEVLNGTDRMRLYVTANDDRAQALLVAVYDNLGKGASGAAVQNLDLMIQS